MATLKNPSIYDDRGTIGSADELDEYGVWVKLEPEELSDEGEDHFPDFEADFAPEISLDETVADDVDFEAFAFSGDGEDANFDDIEALRQDMQSSSPVEPASDVPAEPAVPEPAAPPTAMPGAPDLSTQLLMKIVEELSSIKDELSTFKGELSTIRSEMSAHSAPGADAEDAGFFDEEDDDKIALTGDELDNIIHTAAFTEETGFDAGDSPADDFAVTEAPPPPQAMPPPSGGGAEILYDGLGRPLNRQFSEEDDIDVSFNENDELKTLRENGVEPMTAAPEDTSYLEEDPLAEETLDLSDAVIDEPDLSEGVRDTPLEEPSLDNLSLIDLENIEPPLAKDEETIEEKPFFEDISFEDLSDPEGSLDSESITDIENPDEEETTDLSVFEDDFPLEGAGGSTDIENAGDLSFEALDEDAELPVQENVQDNVITEDSFESISLDDGIFGDLTIDEDLEQPLTEDMKLELDFPSLEIEEIVQDAEAEDDKNFEFPGSADTADAGDPTIATAEAPPAIKMELRDVLIYMDKLLESLPEEKINEFAQSKHYNTYKKLFEELGIQ
jgi:hypothetical protein